MKVITKVALALTEEEKIILNTAAKLFLEELQIKIPIKTLQIFFLGIVQLNPLMNCLILFTELQIPQRMNKFQKFFKTP